LVPEASAIKVLEDARGSASGSRAPIRSRLTSALGDSLQGAPAQELLPADQELHSHEIALSALEMNAVAVAVAEYRVAEKWLSKNKGRVIQETKSVPSLRHRIERDARPGIRRKIRDALLSPSQAPCAFAQLASVGIVEIKARRRRTTATFRRWVISLRRCCKGIRTSMPRMCRT